MVTLAIDAPAVCVALRRPRVRPTAALCRVGTRATATLPPGDRAPFDQLVIVEAVSETPLGELRSAVLRSTSDKLNGIGEIEFICDANDPTLLDCLVDASTEYDGRAHLKLLGREVQHWRDGQLRWSGPLIVADVDVARGTVTFQGVSLAWYILAMRFMGPAQRRDLLNGIGSMDKAGLPGWTRSGVTAVCNTTTKARGRGSAELIGVGAMTAAFIHPEQTASQDGTVHLTAMVRLNNATPVGTAVMTIQATPSDATTVYRPGDYNTFYTDESTELGRWIRIKVFCRMRPGRTNGIQVTLWSHSASVRTYFDDVRAIKNDTTGINPAGDLTEHAAALLNHFQGDRWASFGIKDVVPLSQSGTREVMGARHAEHTQGSDRFAMLTDRDDGIDWWINPQDRRMYVAARRGVDHDDLPLTDRTVMGGGWSHDESRTANAVVVLGEGDVDRPEGSYVDTTRTNGLMFGAVVRPPNSTPLSALDAMAKFEVQQRSQPQTTMTGLKVLADLWEDTQPGDTFPTDFACGVLIPATGDGRFRVQEITHRFDDETLELT